MVPAADPSPRGGEPVNVAHVLERTSAALDGVGGHVIYERAVSAAGEKYFSPGEHGLSERWHAPDGSAFRYRASVNRVPRVDLSRNARAETFVDYRNRTYRTRPGDPPNPSQFDDLWTPEEIQKAITDGRGTVLGPGGPIHGIPTVRLTVEAEGKATVPTELWVDAKTYLPVRWRWLQEGPSSVFDVKFLPPTPKNLDKLTAPIPPGFTDVG